MANVKPYMTSDDLIESIKRRISFPLSQNTFQYSDLMAFINEEIQISAVPSVKQEHEEYFVYKVSTDLVDGISRYEIPNRAIGMALRDIKYSDSNGNFYDMSRIAPDDKAFFQQSNGSNQTVGKFYLEGNEIVLTPQILAGASGKVNMWIYLRPNSLVKNDRACIIQHYHKDITILDNSLIVAGDKISIITGAQTPTPVSYVFTATTGSPTGNEFLIAGTSAATAANLKSAIDNAGITDIFNTVANTDGVSLEYYTISDSFSVTNALAFEIDNENITIEFDQLPTTYLNPETMETSSLYEVGSEVDFLQTNPGHRTYTFDIPIVSIDGVRASFKARDLQSQQTNSTGGVYTYYNIKLGDYICLQNECIIPQIPPELHTALAERAASRILYAIGDTQGYAASQQKIAMMDKQTETLIGSRVESSVTKVFNRNSLLRLGKSRFRRRY